jgi:eukaryotic-like serine/threonine-protein kinase
MIVLVFATETGEIPQPHQAPRAVTTDLKSTLHDTLSDAYTIERELGGGGMSRVFLAEDLALGRRVVVKVLDPELAAGVNAERFKREIQLTARLQHPHIVPILNTGEVDGLPYYMMPFEEGDSLRVRLARCGALPVWDAASILRDVARALEYAHDKGIVHRDIKPENVLLAGSTAAVADFGVAKALATSRASSDTQALTEIGMAIGTPQYMAPEQAAGDSGVDHRADIYAFGCLAYEVLTGEPPFVGPPSAQIFAHISKVPTPIGVKRADIPQALATLIGRCLEKDPAHRPASARDLIAVLDLAASEMAQQRTGQSFAGRPGIATVAVLPFANLSPDPENEYLADGLTEEVITDLSMLKTLRVISRQSAMRLKGSDKDVRAIAHELGTRYVLTGGVRKMRNDVRITAQLTDAETDATIWADKFSGAFDDMLDLQERLSRQIVDALRVRLTPSEERRIAQRAIGDPRAYDLYLRARQHIWSFNAPALEKGLQLIRQAREIVGDNELLIAAEGLIYWQYVNVGIAPANTYDEYLQKAEECAAKIFAIDPDSSKGYSLRGSIRNNRGDPTGSMRDFKRALALDPNEPEALLWLGYGYGVAGQIPMSLAYLDRLLAVDPLTSINLTMRGMASMFDGDFAGASRWTERSVELDPESPTSRNMHAWMLAATGRVDDAVELLEAVARETSGMAWTTLASAMAAALRRDRNAVLKIMTPELRESARWDDLFCWWSADCLALVGETGAAIDFVERAVALGIINHPFLSRHEPFLASLRGEERFVRLMEQVHRAWEVFDG